MTFFASARERAPKTLFLHTIAVSRSRLTLVAIGAAPARADGPGVGTPTVVSVGDSYISGEAGRWAGNTNGSSSNTDALGSDRLLRQRLEHRRDDQPLPPLQGGRDQHRRRRRQQEPRVLGREDVDFTDSGWQLQAGPGLLQRRRRARARRRCCRTTPRRTT